MNDMLFSVGDLVMHNRSRDVYEITDLPTDNRLEATGEGAYGYKLPSEPKWWRGKSQMEDGRFTKIEIQTHSESSK